MSRIWGLLCLPGFLLAQAPPDSTFEVASVKVSTAASPGRQISGGPGSTHPGSATFENVDLSTIVTMAYDLKTYQLSDPDWLASARYNISAKIPAGTTVAQYRVMLRNLLAERFHLVARLEKKEGEVYDLMVGKGGPKLKASPPDTVVREDGLQPPRTFSPPLGYNGPISIDVVRYSMDKFAATLSGFLKQPVFDATNLDGLYDIKLTWTGLQAPSSNAREPGHTMFDAVQELGLRLVPRKGMIDTLVIEHVDRIPVEN